MAKPEHLANPPIQEAVIDFVFGGCSADEATLKALALALGDSGWVLEGISETKIAARFDAVKQTADLIREASTGIIGYAIRTENRSVVIQIREDRLTISHTKSYSDWDRLAADATRAFIAFCDRLRPLHIARIATRFINRLSIERKDPPEFLRYLTNPPRVVEEEGLVGAYITDFARRQVIRGIQGGYSALLNVATVSPDPGESQIPLLVDVDVMKTGEFPIDQEGLERELHTLRMVKNAIFFGSVTPEALGPYRSRS